MNAPHLEEDANAVRRTALLQSIPDDDVAEFSSIYALELQTAIRAATEQARAGGDLDPDHDAIEWQLIEKLLRDADGIDDPNGIGLVPLRREGLVEWFEVPDPAKTQPALPTRTTRAKGARTATTKGAQADPQGLRQWGLTGLVLIPIVAYIAWVFFGSGTGKAVPTKTAATASADTAVPTSGPITDVNPSGVQWSDPASLEIGHREQTSPTTVLRIVPKDGKVGGAWDFATDEGVASWLRGTYVNYVMCVPPSGAGLVNSIQVGDPFTLRSVNGASRRLTVVRRRSVQRQETEVLAQDHSGLALITCGTEGTERTVVEALAQEALQGREDRPLAASALEQGPGPQVLTGTASISLRSVEWLPDVLPVAGYARLQVTADIKNLGGMPLLPSDLQAVVTEASGTPLAPDTTTWTAPVLPKTASTAQHWTYLVPTDMQQTRWIVTAATGEQRVWPLLVPSPVAAAAITLHASVPLADVAAQDLGTGSYLLRFVVEITNHGPDAAPVQLDTLQLIGPTGLAYLVQGQANAVLAKEVGANATVRLPLQATLTRTPEVRLVVGSQQFRITFPQ